MPTYPHDPLQVGDYNKSNYSGVGGVLSTDDFSITSYNYLTLTATGRGWINKTGMTKLCLRADTEIAGTTPTSYEIIQIYSGNQGNPNRKPILQVTYTSETEEGEDEEEYSVNITNLPVQLGERFGIPTFGAGIFLSIIALLMVCLPLLVLRVKPVYILFFGLGLMAFLVVLGWFPYWLTLLVGLVVVAAYLIN